MTSVGSAAQPVEAVQPSSSKQKGPNTGSRPQRPNYAKIHARPLPLEVYPLPVFIPHNPLSLVRIAITLISHSLWPQNSHPVVYTGVFSAETQSVHVIDWDSVRALWEQGFWGSGSLSRTEPQWLDHEKKKRVQGKPATAWAVTQNRREERRQFKLERARQQREAVEQQLRDEGKLDSSSHVADVATVVDPLLLNTPEDGIESSKSSEKLSPRDTNHHPETDGYLVSPDVDLEVVNQEHLQLTLEEAFFLTYSLGVLDVFRPQDQALLSSSYLFRLYCAYSRGDFSDSAEQDLYDLYHKHKLNQNKGLYAGGVSAIAPDNAFLLRYAVFHHFRSLGWVVKDGIKFSVDYLLYQRGPVFAHAQFGIMIIPSYSHSYWSATPERKAECDRKERRDWWWLHRVNRVMSQAVKTLVLVYVEVPPPWDNHDLETCFDINLGEVLKKYKVREFMFQRWSPNRQKN